MRHLPAVDRSKRYGRVGVAIFFYQSIGIDETNTFQLKIRTDRQTDMARSTRLVILIKNIYTLWGRKRFLLPVT